MVPTLREKAISTKLKKFRSNSLYKKIWSKANLFSQADQTPQAKFRGRKTEANFKIRAIFRIRKAITSQRAKIHKRKLLFLKSAMKIIIIWSLIWIYKSNIQFMIKLLPLKSILSLLQLIIRSWIKVSKVKVLYSNKTNK